LNSEIFIRTPAKVNFVLEVLKKRPDQYHEISTIFQAINLYDEITISATHSKIDFQIEPPDVLKADPSNLVMKAVEIFFENVLKKKAGISIRLKKQIPIAAGLGGGSSNAAGMLVGLNQLFQTDLPLTRMQQLARTLGADVPFFLTGGMAWGTGRGDQIQPISSKVQFYMVLLKIKKELSTAQVYQHEKIIFSSEPHQTQEFLKWCNRSDVNQLIPFFFNGLEPAILSLMPEIAAIKGSLALMKPLKILVSGSGPTIFVILEAEKDQDDFFIKTKTWGLDVFKCQSILGGIEWHKNI
jgi:4-diphosphocytidyl-2-C-methyl-D-erythritol kinase